MKTEYHSNGKLLISGEYGVLDGAVGLAFPTKFGQSLRVSPFPEPVIIWRSFDHENNIWFQGDFSLSDFKASRKSPVSNRLTQILLAVRNLNHNFLKKEQGFLIETFLDFPKLWGLGTSSTLINNIAQWAQVDPFKLLELTFGGSGYDIAAAQNQSPILFRKTEGIPSVQTVFPKWNFSENLYFIYLNKKKNSRDAISHYKKNRLSSEGIKRISEISKSLVTSEDLQSFRSLLEEHEEILSTTLKIEPIKKQFFSDYSGTVKSLGGWGGDFILVTAENHELLYFRERNYNTIIPFREMIW